MSSHPGHIHLPAGTPRVTVTTLDGLLLLAAGSTVLRFPIAAIERKPLLVTRKLLLASASAITLFALAACNGETPQEPTPEDPEGAPAPGVEEPGEMPEMPEPDVDDVPDVVATVNGTDLTGEDFTTLYQVQFQQMAMQAQMTGEEPDQEQLRGQTLNAMIDSELLVQDAQERGYEATDDDVNNVLEQTAESNQMSSVDELLDQYAEQGITEDQLRNDAQTQLLVEELIENDIEVAEPTDDEVEALYEQMSAGADEGNDYSLDEIRPELETQIRNQNQSQAVGAHVEDLREDADVQTNM